MDVKKARKLLGKDAVGQTDEQIQKDIDTAQLLAEIAIDTLMKMPPERRKELDKELKSKNATRKI